jgi:hypothetical protein
MKKLLLILLCLPVIGFGQEFETTFGGTYDDEGYSVQQTTDGGYVIAGLTWPSSDIIPIVYLIKSDGNGMEQWNQTFGVSDEDAGVSVQQTTDGGYIIAGLSGTLPDNSADVYLIKTDGNGIEQWSQTFGGAESECGYSVQQTTDGGYIITGYTYSFGNGGAYVYLIKTDGYGTELWNKTFGGGGSFNNGYSVQQTTDGGYIITGNTQAFGNGGADVYLIKTDGYGTELWNKTFGGTGNESARSVQQTTDGGYIITGNTTSFGNGENDVYLIKTDVNGIELWNKTFGGTGDDYGLSVQQTTDGGYIITGFKKYSGTNDLDVYLIKTDVNGVEQWNKIFGDTGYQAGHSVQQTTDGGYIITGAVRNFGNQYTDVYLIKTDGNGNVTSTFNISTPNPNRNLQKTVDILGKETKPQPNTPFIEIYDDGTVEKRIVIE